MTLTSDSNKSTEHKYQLMHQLSEFVDSLCRKPVLRNKLLYSDSYCEQLLQILIEKRRE